MLTHSQRALQGVTLTTHMHTPSSSIPSLHCLSALNILHDTPAKSALHSSSTEKYTQMMVQHTQRKLMHTHMYNVSHQLVIIVLPSRNKYTKMKTNHLFTPLKNKHPNTHMLTFKHPLYFKSTNKNLKTHIYQLWHRLYIKLKHNAVRPNIFCSSLTF